MRYLEIVKKAVCSLLLLAGFAVAQSAPAPRVVAVDINGIIHPVTVEIVSHAIEQARQQGASALLIRLNTPGGLLDATREIIQHLTASPVPVITYVTPSGARAASAGFFILEAGDIAAMSPGTNTGAASPVLMGQQMDPVMRSKVENDAAALLRSLTSKRGRNSQLAESTVREAKAFTEKEALDGKLIDLIATDERNLFDQLNGRQITMWSGKQVALNLAGATIVAGEISWRERFVAAIADPNIGFILLIIGALLIYVEFTAPGHIIPGVVGSIFVLLALSALSVLPINWAGAGLLVLGMAMLVLEMKFTTHGALATGGIVAMILGALLLIQGPPEVRIHLSTAIAVTLPFAGITLLLVWAVVRGRRDKAIMDHGGVINEIGVARTALTPEGKVLVHGEYWDAISSTPIDEGATVRVQSVDGLRLKVEPAQRV